VIVIVYKINTDLFQNTDNYVFNVRTKNVTDFLREKYVKKRYINLCQDNPVRLEIPPMEKNIIKEIKVEENKNSMKQEVPNLLNKLKSKIDLGGPKVLIKNKYKLFLDNYSSY